jgi:hypothetical protein
MMLQTLLALAVMMDWEEEARLDRLNLIWWL